MSIITTQNLKKEYSFKGGTIPVLQGIDLSIEKGEFIGIIGPSGSGKTTLMGILGGLLSLTSGKVQIDGSDLENLSKEQLADFRLKNLGFIFQSNHLVPTLTAIENIEVPLLLAKIPAKDRKKIAFEKAKEVGIEKKVDFLYDELSGGEKQRVGVARALANNPKLILADEPTGSLDSMTGSEIIQLLKSISKKTGATVIIVSHDPAHYTKFERILRLEKGKLIPMELTDTN